MIGRIIGRLEPWGIIEAKDVTAICALAAGFGEGMLADPDVVAHFSDETTDPRDRVPRF